jgi:hypothetical protein
MIRLFSKLATEEKVLQNNKEFETAISDLQHSELITTDKILIENNLISLPSQPDGALVFNAAMVYDDDSVVEIYDEMSVETVTTITIDESVEPAIEKTVNTFFARFDDLVTDVNGRYGVVSYLSKVQTLK